MIKNQLSKTHQVCETPSLMALPSGHFRRRFDVESTLKFRLARWVIPYFQRGQQEAKFSLVKVYIVSLIVYNLMSANREYHMSVIMVITTLFKVHYYFVDNEIFVVRRRLSLVLYKDMIYRFISIYRKILAAILTTNSCKCV